MPAHLLQDPRFAPVQALLAAAPADAPARRNFGRSLVSQPPALISLCRAQADAKPS